MPNQLRCLAALCAVLVAAPPLHAQAVGADSTRGFWLGGSLGLAAVHPEPPFSAAVAGTLALNVQRGAWLTSARWHSLGLGIGDDVQAISLLIGRATMANSFAFSAISLGPTAVWRRPCTAGCGLFSDTPHEVGPAAGGVGVMLAGDAALRASGVGLGLTGYLNLNTARYYAGVGLELTLGKWR